MSHLKHFKQFVKAFYCVHTEFKFWYIFSIEVGLNFYIQGLFQKPSDLDLWAEEKINLIHYLLLKHISKARMYLLLDPPVSI